MSKTDIVILDLSHNYLKKLFCMNISMGHKNYIFLKAQIEVIVYTMFLMLTICQLSETNYSMIMLLL